MNMVSGKCPNCGYSLNFESGMEKGFCISCGSPVQVRDAVQRLKVEHSGSVQLKGAASDDTLVKRGYMAIDTGDFQSAINAFNDALRINPDNYLAWKGLFISYLEFTKKHNKHNCYLGIVYYTVSMRNIIVGTHNSVYGLKYETAVKALDTAIKLAPPDVRKELNDLKEQQVTIPLGKIEKVINWSKQRLCLYCGGKISFLNKCKTCGTKEDSGKPLF